MTKFIIAIALCLGPSLVMAQSGPTPTWNGLAFGMTKDEVKAVLKGRQIHIKTEDEVKADNEAFLKGGVRPDDGNLLSITGDLVVGEGKATLRFSPADRLQGIELWFKFGDYADDASTVSEQEALRRVDEVKSITEKYLRRYGRPVSDIGEGFPGDGTEGNSHAQWEYDLIRHRSWLVKHSWRWREGGQSIELRGDLLGRAAVIFVNYALEERNF
jgi:hypothetical protein